jgi:hypothetical protein
MGVGLKMLPLTWFCLSRLLPEAAARQLLQKVQRLNMPEARNSLLVGLPAAAASRRPLNRRENEVFVGARNSLPNQKFGLTKSVVRFREAGRGGWGVYDADVGAYPSATNLPLPLLPSF